MAIIVVECPACKMPATVKMGLFAKKEIKCEDCGCVVKVEKMAEEPCPQCGSTVTYDRTKTYTPTCPSCKHVINVGARLTKAMHARTNKMFAAYSVDLSELEKPLEEE